MEYMDEDLTEDEFVDEDDVLLDEDDIETGRNGDSGQDDHKVNGENAEAVQGDVVKDVSGYKETDKLENKEISLFNKEETEQNMEKAQQKEKSEKHQELPAMEYVAKKHEEFMQKYRGNASLEEKWNALRSQINSGLMLQVKQKNIDKYATLDYDYMQREVLKFYIWQGASEQLVDIMMKKETHGEMVSAYDEYKAADRASALLEKATTNITQVLQSYVDSFTAFKEDTAKRTNEYDTKIESLEETIRSKESEINNKNEEVENLKNEIKRLNDSIYEEKKRLETEKEIERRVNAIVEQRIDERQELEKQVMQQNMPYYHEEKRWSIFGKRKKTPGTNTKPIILFHSKEKLPDNFNLSEYMIGRELSTAQMEVITMAVKCGVNDSVIKQMIDSNKSSAQMRQALEFILARKQSAQHINDIREEDIIYDEQQGSVE